MIATDFEDVPRWVRTVLPSLGRIYTWENIKINADKKTFVMQSHNQTGVRARAARSLPCTAVRSRGIGRDGSGSTLLDIAETCSFTPHPENPEWTLYTQVCARVSCVAARAANCVFPVLFGEFAQSFDVSVQTRLFRDRYASRARSPEGASCSLADLLVLCSAFVLRLCLVLAGCARSCWVK